MSNAEKRQAAQDAGRDNYDKEIVRTRLACVVCDEPLGESFQVPNKPGFNRFCGCPEIIWRGAEVFGHYERVPVGDL